MIVVIRLGIRTGKEKSVFSIIVIQESQFIFNFNAFRQEICKSFFGKIPSVIAVVKFVYRQSYHIGFMFYLFRNDFHTKTYSVQHHKSIFLSVFIMVFFQQFANFLRKSFLSDFFFLSLSTS